MFDVLDLYVHFLILLIIIELMGKKHDHILNHILKSF